MMDAIPPRSWPPIPNWVIEQIADKLAVMQQDRRAAAGVALESIAADIRQNATAETIKTHLQILIDLFP